MSEIEEVCKISEISITKNDNLKNKDEDNALMEKEKIVELLSDNEGIKAEDTNQNQEIVSKITDLEKELKNATSERDDYRQQMIEMEKKLTDMQSSYNSVINGGKNEVGLHSELEKLKNKLSETQLRLEDRVRTVISQENQINALNKQVSSLKEVVQITKDLLNIRNMEVKHLQQSVDSMDSKISAEKQRHNAMLTKMDAAVRLNEDLKREYETQLKIFQDLRTQYEKKVALLSEEKKNLQEMSSSNC